MNLVCSLVRLIFTFHNLLTLTIVLMYLALIRLEELGFPKYGRFVRCFDPTKMSRLIGFLFDPASLEGDLKTMWFSVLDAEYVKEHILAPMHKNLPSAQILLSDLCERSDKGLVPKKSKKPATGMY